MGRRWRKKPLAERLLPAWVYVVLTVLCLGFGIWCWAGIDETPLERSRPIAVLVWIMMPIVAGLAVLSHRARGRR